MLIKREANWDIAFIDTFSKGYTFFLLSLNFVESHFVKNAKCLAVMTQS